MLAEFAGWAKFAKLVPHHVLGDKHRYMHATVVYSEGKTYHLWRDRTAASPGLDNRAVANFQACYFLGKLGVDEWAFFE